MKTPRRTRLFWQKVRCGAEHECWPWLGYIAPNGRGMTFHRYVSMLCGRKAWILTHGEIPDGFCVNHRCDNGLCCNPAHMYLGTRADNMIDRWGKLAAGDRRHQLGRRRVVSDEQMVEVGRQHEQGATLVDLAKKFRVTAKTLGRRLKELREVRLSGGTKQRIELK